MPPLLTCFTDDFAIGKCCVGADARYEHATRGYPGHAAAKQALRDDGKACDGGE